MKGEDLDLPNKVIKSLDKVHKCVDFDIEHYKGLLKVV